MNQSSAPIIAPAAQDGGAPPWPGQPSVALIAGPTASGKSALAIFLAKSLQQAGRGAVIINADASQVYADIPILSAAPDAQEQAQAPHRLFGHIDAAHPCNAAQWAAQARAAMAQAIGAGAVPILVGGTGLYLRTLLDGIAPVPPIDDAIRRAVRAMPVDAAHAQLALHDAGAAARLHRADTTRVQRALEVALSTGRTLAQWQGAAHGGLAAHIHLNPMLLLPPREWLRARCDQRLASMVQAGALAEVERLMARALPADNPAMRAIGVREFSAHIQGDITLDAAIDRARIATHQYAKRQYTWFRNQSPPTWPRHDGDVNYDIIDKIVIKLRDNALTD